MSFVHFLILFVEWVGGGLVVGCLIGLVAGPLIDLVAHISYEREQAKIPGTPQYRARLDREARKSNATSRRNSMYQPPPYGQPPQTPPPQQQSIVDVDVLALQDKRSLLDDLLAALDSVTKQKIFGPKGTMVRGTLMSREQIIEATRKCLVELLSDTETVINNQGLLSQQLQQVQQQLQTEQQQHQRELQAVQAENQRLLYERQHGTFDGRWITNAELQKIRDDDQRWIVENRDRYAATEKALHESWRAEKSIKEQLRQAQAEIEGLKRQLQTVKEDAAETQAMMTLAKQESDKQIVELQGLSMLLTPQRLRNGLTASYNKYLERFVAAREEADMGKTQGRFSVKAERDYVDTLFYSYTPSEVTSAASMLLKKLDEISVEAENGGKSRVLPKAVLPGLAGFLGYYNLYRYLSQAPSGKSDSGLLPMLRNLAIPTEEIIEQVDRADTNICASLWLEEHLPPIGSAPNPCCFTPTHEAGISFTKDFLKYRSDYWMSQFRSPDWEPQHGKSYWISVGRDIAQEIIATEMSNLLDFRKSLYLFLAALTPSTQGEQERSGDDLVVSVKEVTEENGSHYYRIQLSDKTRFSGSRSFIVTVPDEGEIGLSEDDANG
jgi:hypothetical protein